MFIPRCYIHLGWHFYDCEYDCSLLLYEDYEYYVDDGNNNEDADA